MRSNTRIDARSTTTARDCAQAWAKEAFKLRSELVERSFALTLDRGGMRRSWLRGCENLRKRYLVHVAGYNLGLIMRLLVGAGTPRGVTVTAVQKVTVGQATVMACLSGFNVDLSH